MPLTGQTVALQQSVHACVQLNLTLPQTLLSLTLFCRLVSLPSHIGNLQLLNELHLRNNQLPFFPASITRLPLFTFTAQNNPTITEEQSHQVCGWPDVPFPSLLELAARAVVGQAVAWSPGSLPSNLESKPASGSLTADHCPAPL